MNKGENIFAHSKTMKTAMALMFQLCFPLELNWLKRH